jgi:hypothetical protein
MIPHGINTNSYVQVKKADKNGWLLNEFSINFHQNSLHLSNNALLSAKMIYAQFVVVFP